MIQKNKMIYFIINPSSASGKALRIWKKLEILIKRQDIVYQAFMTGYPGHAASIADSLTAGEEKNLEKTLVVLGGDGTLNETLQGLHLQAKVRLACIPAGFANHFSKALRLPSAPRKALASILNQEDACSILDYGMITCAISGEAPFHRRFLVNSGVGFDAAAYRQLRSSWIKKAGNRSRLGRLFYIAAGTGQIFWHRRCGGELALDGGRRIPLRRISFISAHILHGERKNFRFVSDEDTQDGVWSLCVAAGISRLAWIPVWFWALFGICRLPKGVEYFCCREAEIFLQEPLPVHTDGEICGNMKQIHFRCEARKIRFVAEKEETGDEKKRRQKIYKK